MWISGDKVKAIAMSTMNYGASCPSFATRNVTLKSDHSYKTKENS